jgi:hypothetical protein
LLSHNGIVALICAVWSAVAATSVLQYTSVLSAFIAPLVISVPTTLVPAWHIDEDAAQAPFDVTTSADPLVVALSGMKARLVPPALNPR